MKEQIRVELKILTDIIVDTVPVKQIFLFGSYAGGEPNVDSDLDIYVVMAESANIREIDAIRLIRKAIRDKKTMPVDIVVSKEKKFNQRISAPTIERKIFEEGVVLHG